MTRRTEPMPCGHALTDYDIIVFGGPGGVVKCMICGHEVRTPPSDLWHEMRRRAEAAARERDDGEDGTD